MEPRNEITLKTCHDIRHWSACAICEGVGDNRKMLKVGKERAHGSCVVETMTDDRILSLPIKETDKLTMGDCSQRPGLMRALVDRHG